VGKEKGKLALQPGIEIREGDQLKNAKGGRNWPTYKLMGYSLLAYGTLS